MMTMMIFFDSIGDHHYAPELRQIINSGYQIFDDSWTTEVREHKVVLCDKIIKRYYFNQICSDTPDRFIHYINEHLARIMPYYNQLYKSELIKFNPLFNQVLTMSGSSAEEMARLASTDKTSVGKVLRDFIQSKQGISNLTGNVKGSLDDNIRKDYNENYTEDKEGTRNNTQTRDLEENTTKSGESDSTKDTTTSNTANKTTRRADTPQCDVDGNVMSNYLTEYVSETGSENGTAKEVNNATFTETNNTTQTGTVKDEETTTDNKTADTTSDETTTRGQTTNEDTTKDTKDKSFEQSRNDETTSNGEAKSENEKENKTSKEESKMEGYTNVSPSSLLMSFRETFLNIDNMIIDELSTNFMEVF